MKYSAKLKEKARELRDGGMSYGKIAAELGVSSHKTIAYWLDPAVRERHRQYERDNRDRINARNNADPARKESARKRANNWYYNNKEQAIKTTKEYRLAHMDEMKEYFRAYNEARKEETRLYGIAYREKNREEIRANKATYYTLNKDHIIAKSAEANKKRRQLVSAGNKRITTEQYNAIWEEQEGLCFYCGEPMLLNVDPNSIEYCNNEHVNPISNGGFHELGNLVYACRGCNLSKGNKLVENWRAEMLDKIYSNKRLNYDIEENNRRWLI